MDWLKTELIQQLSFHANLWSHDIWNITHLSFGQNWIEQHSFWFIFLLTLLCSKSTQIKFILYQDTKLGPDQLYICIPSKLKSQRLKHTVLYECLLPLSQLVSCPQYVFCRVCLLYYHTHDQYITTKEAIYAHAERLQNIMQNKQFVFTIRYAKQTVDNCFLQQNRKRTRKALTCNSLAERSSSLRTRTWRNTKNAPNPSKPSNKTR